MKQQNSSITYLEKHFFQIIIIFLTLSAFTSFSLPFLFQHIQLFDLTAPNEIGDAFGGMTNPLISLIGVFLTFFAFHIQYKANERQTNELEKQKRFTEYRYVQESINGIKDDIRYLSYTKNGVNYQYSEAIWNFMCDNLAKIEEGQEMNLGASYHQISYALTLFKPIVEEIEASNLDKKDKSRALQDLFALFESSLELILTTYQQHEDSKKIPVKGDLKSKVIIPAKRVKFMLKDKLSQYKEPEKEVFNEFVSKIRGASFIKYSKVIGEKANITFFRSYDQYTQSKPTDPAPQTAYEKLFNKEDNVKKMLITESIRLLSKMDFIQKITIVIPCNVQIFTIEIDREEAEFYLQLDLAELNIDKDMWRDDFQGKYVYDNEELQKFISRFVTISSK